MDLPEEVLSLSVLQVDGSQLSVPPRSTHCSGSGWPCSLETPRTFSRIELADRWNSINQINSLSLPGHRVNSSPLQLLTSRVCPTRTPTFLVLQRITQVGHVSEKLSFWFLQQAEAGEYGHLVGTLSVTPPSGSHGNHRFFAALSSLQIARVSHASLPRRHVPLFELHATQEAEKQKTVQHSFKGNIFQLRHYDDSVLLWAKRSQAPFGRRTGATLRIATFVNGCPGVAHRAS